MVGPQATVRIGYFFAYSMVIKVPSFCDRYSAALVTPSSFRLLANPSVNRSATLHRAAFKIVAFSLSINPIDPISLDMEIRTSGPRISLQSCAARSSWSLRTVENTQEMATDSTFPLISRKNSAAASSSKGASSFPSYSKPPPITATAFAAALISSAQSTMGGIPRAAGAPMRRMPMSASCFLSTMALVHWVVPSIAMEISSLFTPEACKTSRTAHTMPS